MTKLFTIFLLAVLIFTRISSRYNNQLWIDETAQIESLQSVNYLILKYLPGIPGGSPGHYFLTLSIKEAFGTDKYILGMPGLLSHILVFIAIPKIVQILSLRKYSSTLITAIARAGFVFSPFFIFQAMEIRPYSMLPLLWVCSFFLVRKILLLDNPKEKKKASIGLLVLYIVFTFFISVWHFYGLLMVGTIYCYLFLENRSFPKNKAFPPRSFLVIIISTLISLPFLRYFSTGSFGFRFNTFEMVPRIFLGVLPFPKSSFESILPDIIIINLIILFGLLVLVPLYHTNYRMDIASKKYSYFFLILILLPVVLILILDLATHYWFLLRQFTWVFIPFYIWLGWLVSSIFERNLRGNIQK